MSNPKEKEANAVCVSGFKVFSKVGEIEKSVDCNQMVTGENLSVMDMAGNVIFSGLRAFMPLGNDFLIRNEQKEWILVHKGKQTKLKKVNLQHEGLALLFDERGKLHYNQASPHYRSLPA